MNADSIKIKKQRKNKKFNVPFLTNVIYRNGEQIKGNYANSTIII